MTRQDRTAEEQTNIQQDLFSQHLQEIMPFARTMQSGPYSFVTLENANYCFQQVAENVFDVTGQTADGQKTDQQGLTADELEHLLLTQYRAENPDSIPTSPTWKDNEDLEKEKANEQTATGGVAGYNPAKAFSSPHQKINRAVEQSKREGWTLRESVEWQLKELVKHLQAILPIEADDIAADEYGNINIESNELRIWIKPKGANLFDVQTCVGDTPQPRQVALPLSKMLQFVFDSASVEKQTETLVGNVGKEKKKTILRASHAETDPDDDISTSDAYEVLKELAVETGAYGGDDILRNKSLYDLRSLVVSKNNSLTPQPFVTLSEQLAERFDNRPPMDQKTNLREQVTPRNLRAENLKGGAPVSLNENRNVCHAPYHDTLGGKVLVMDPQQGAVLVDKSRLAPGMKLSWDKEQGAVMVPNSEETKRPSWKPYWQQQYD